jgi:hypothetical protein
MLATVNLLDLAMFAQLLVIVGLLIWAARLPRRTAAVLVLVLLVPWLYESLAQVVGGTGFGIPLGPFGWLGIAAEVTLVGTAVWWLTRDPDSPDRTDRVNPVTPARS